METKVEAESEQKPVVDKTVDSKPEETIKKKPTNDSTLQRLTPALIVSVSILISSGMLSATSFAKSKDMAPQVRNFYYQLPPPGPYMSNLAMPQHPMNQSNWARPMQHNNNLTEDQKSSNRNRPQAMVPPPWVNQPPQMNHPQWARPMPPWIQNGMQNSPKQQNNLTEDQKSANRNRPQTMVPPAWVNQPPHMNRPQWARPMPPWIQNGMQNTPKQQNNLTADQQSKQTEPSQTKMPPNFNPAPPAWVQRQQQMMPPSRWTRPAPPWFQQPARH